MGLFTFTDEEVRAAVQNMRPSGRRPLQRACTQLLSQQGISADLLRAQGSGDLCLLQKPMSWSDVDPRRRNRARDALTPAFGIENFDSRSCASKGSDFATTSRTPRH